MVAQRVCAGKSSGALRRTSRGSFATRLGLHEKGRDAVRGAVRKDRELFSSASFTSSTSSASFTSSKCRYFLTLTFLLLTLALPGFAHVGSPDVFLEGNAGPYKLFVTVRVPQVIPGIAQIEIRSESADVREIRIAPMQLTGPGSQYAPTPDVAERSKTDPQFFTGNLWLMEFGSLQVRIDADGARGAGHLSVPVPAVAQRTLAMQKPLGILLFGLMLFLAAAVVSIASAAVREGDLVPGTAPPPAQIRRSYLALAVAAAVVIGVLFIGAEWWKSDDARFARRVYSPPQLNATLSPNGHLALRASSGPITSGNPRRPADTITLSNLIPDHEHLMHFFMVRTPQMDSFWHLHPTPGPDETFSLDLPNIPPGHYQLFADVVLKSGFPVTMVGQLDVPAFSGRTLTGDDSGIDTEPLSPKDNVSFNLPDGGKMIWQRAAAPLKSNEPISFRFDVQDKTGQPARDLEPYMGMAAHAEIIRSDSSVFAHVHPAGSVSMAALDLAQMGVSPNSQASAADSMPGMSGMNMPGMDMPGMSGASEPIGSEVSFPYGFPKPGLYRIFVQIKRSGKIQTAVFDATVN